MKLTKQAVALAVAGMISASSSWAVTFGDGGLAVQTILDDITVNPAGNSSVNAGSDYLTNDAYWAIGGSGGALNIIVSENGSFAPNNSYGIYDASTNQYVQLFAGSNVPGNKKVVSILADGSVEVNFVDTGIDFAGNKFAFYLSTPNGVFFSDTSLNGDGFDHMAAYQGKGDIIQILPNAAGAWTANEYILAWEDLYGGGDKDYDDFLVLVESVTNVPVPATLALMGLGLVGLGYNARRNKKNA